MPVYEYSCDDCGTNFEESAPISRFAEPCACPACGAMAKRNLLSAPQLSTVNPTARKAHMVNERASDSPRRAKANGLTPSGPKIKSRARTHAGGAKSMPGARPWMLSH